MVKNGIRNFVISHLSQVRLIPKNCRIISNENIYVFKAAAAKFVISKEVYNFSYPQEIDFENLFALSHKNGIVPVYFHPELFYSHMPVSGEEEILKDDNNLQIQRFRRNGITSIVPNAPVSITQSRNQLRKYGFY